ncbi:family 20 glycosylhydrolase [candidate division KSB1 bacterium]|nr:family 20 glycosylhydrolase [candidate division KSB1 bacterium]
MSNLPILAENQMNKELNLIPIPEEITRTFDKFVIDENFTAGITGNPDDRIYQYTTNVLRRLSGRTGLFLSQDFITKTTKAENPQCVIKIDRPGKIVLGEDESYSMNITASGITISSETDLGAMRGLETMLQLLDVDDKGYFLHTVEITDKPRFPWRGLMIDGCRHFMPIDVIKRNLDGMAAVKLNVMHWHLSEDQGFRVECNTFPRLHQLGSDGYYYTQAQIKDVIEYAANRGIRVVPEFDIPGHATSWLVAFPELASAPGPYTIERKWGIFNPTFNPTIDETYEFFDKFFAEMTGLFPDDYMHIGGDENNGKQWDANPDIQAFMKENNIKDNHALQSYFNNKILKILTKYDKKMVGWDEILHPGMPKNIVIQSWRGKESLIESAKQGYQTMLSNGYYIDLIQPTDFHYLNDPLPDDMPLTEDQKKFILGGEATMWAEYISPETIDSRIWPRTAAIAERLWSPGHVKDVESMYKRLDIISFRLEELGLLHIKNYEMMLRRLTANNDTKPLKTLIDVIEPVKIYTRGSQRQYTSYSPLTRVVDAARPDAPVAREFRKNIDIFLTDVKNNSILILLEKDLNLWQTNHSKLVELIKVSPILTEIESLSKDLSDCAEAGLEALNYIKEQKQPGESWIQARQELLEKAQLPRGQTELMIVSAVKKLVNYTEKL